MIVVAQPATPPSVPSVVMVAQGSAGHQTASKREHVLGVCKLVNLRGTGQADLFPVMSANRYFKTPVEKIDYSTAVISAIQQPRHGKLTPNPNWWDARYLPNDGYLGNDSFAIQVQGNGYKVTLKYFVAVIDDMGVTSNPNPMCRGEEWKISLARVGGAERM